MKPTSDVETRPRVVSNLELSIATDVRVGSHGVQKETDNGSGNMEGKHGAGTGSANIECDKGM